MTASIPQVEKTKIVPITMFTRAHDLYRIFMRFLAEDRARTAFWLVIIFIAQFTYMVPPFVLGRIVDGIGARGADDSLVPFYQWTLILAITYIVANVIRLRAKEVIGHIGSAMRYRARVWGFEHLLNASLIWHSNEASGNKVQRLSTGGEALSGLLNIVQQSLTNALASFIGTLIACLFIGPWFALISIVHTIIIFLIEHYFDYRLAIMSDSFNRSSESASGALFEGTSNVQAIKSLGADNLMLSSVRTREQATHDVQRQRISMGNTKWFWFHIVNVIALSLFIVLLIQEATASRISLGSLMTYANYYLILCGVIPEFANVTNRFVEHYTNVQAMMPIFNAQTDDRGATRRFPLAWQRITFDHARFAYQNNELVLQDLSIMIKRGERIGVVGATGSGKSTLLRLLLGLYRVNSGSMKINDLEYRTIMRDEIVQNVAIVPQEIELFSMSLRDNILLGHTVSAERLGDALRIAQLDELIAHLPNGLNTMVGEKGHRLSGGERQRVGIARALCKDASILLFDEATSALDSATEQRIMRALLDYFGRDRTLIIVAHRLSTLAELERILVFTEGRLTRICTYAELKAAV